MKKIVLIVFAVLISIFSFLSLGRIKSQKEIEKENELKIQREKEERMNFSLNENNSKNYEIINSTYAKEVDVNFVEVVHKNTKCKLILMLCEDKNKAFAISFKTIPYNNNGIAHIMEHSVLSGSRKFNVKDPFFELKKSSLATFLNAMTGNDITFFPVSSVNDKDFKNLMDVYLDGVFYPNFYKDKNILKHEGWHYEVDDKNNLTVSGVVLNEMKGENVASPYSMLLQYITEDCFNGTFYEYNFGGKTNEIINLTQEEFEEFHKEYYTPSNAYIMLYGTVDMNERLEYLHDEYLSNFDYVEVDLPNYTIDDYDCIDGTHYYQGNENDKNKSYLSLNYLLDNDKSTMSNIINNIIGYVLFNKQGSLVKDKLIKMGFGEDISFNINNSFPINRFCVIVENIDLDKKNDFIKAFNELIDDVIENGIDYEILDSIFNSIYMEVLDKKDSSIPLGINYLLTLSHAYFYGYPIETNFDYLDCLDSISKDDLKKKDNIVVRKIKKIFKDNSKYCVTVMTPNNNFLKEEEEKINDILYLRKKDMQNINTNYTLEDCKKDYNKFVEWSKEVDTEENLKSIPKLKSTDIERDIDLIDMEIDELYNKKLYKSIQNNYDLVALGIDYYLPKKDEVFDDSEKYFLKVALDLAGTLDTKNYTYKELSTLSDYYTIGVNYDIFHIEKCPIIHLSAKTTKDKIKKVYEIINEIIYNTKFDDKERIKQKLVEMLLISQDYMKDSHTDTANYRSGSKYIYGYELYDKMSYEGYSFNLFINDLVKNYDTKFEEINKGFRYVLNKYFDYNNMFLDCCLSEEFFDEYANETKEFLKNNVIINQEKENVEVDINKILNFDEYKRKFTMEVFVGDKDVNIVSRTYKFDKYKFNGSFFVFNNVFNYDYINKKGRIESGAYSSNMILSRSGWLQFSSKSDPSLVKIDQVFKNIFNYINSLNITQENLDMYIIGAIKSYDRFPLYYSKHIADFTFCLAGDNNEKINKIRHDILDTKTTDIEYFAEVISEYNNESEFCAIIAPSFENEAKENYKIVKRLK